MSQAARSPVSGAFVAELARLASDPLAGVGMPGAGFLGVPGALRHPPAPGGTGRASDRGNDSAAPGESLRELAEAIHSGALSARAVVVAARDRIQASDPVIRAWASLDDSAIDQAAARDDDLSGGEWRGPLHGIPVGVKDMIDVAGVPTLAGSRQWSDPGSGRLPHRDAGVVTLLRRAGAVVMGKTHTHEFAFGGITPPTRNPHDHARIPGGSSGGSAAAVASGHVRVAVGTDTCGSVRIPSAYCGTVGLIPSVGLLPDDGVVPLAWSLDRVGLITATAADLALTAGALGVTDPSAGRDGENALAGLRVGVPSGVVDAPVDPAVTTAFQDVLDTLRAAGAVVTPVEVPHLAMAITAGVTIFLAESLDYHRERLQQHPERFGPDVLATLALAGEVGAADYVHAQRFRQGLRDALLEVLARTDLLVTPTMPSGAPELGRALSGQLRIDGRSVSLATAHLRYNVVANLAALPAATQPMGWDRGGMPLGVQWIGRPGDDGRVVAVTAALERCLNRPVPDGGRKI